jgi:hypothetical protein
VFSRSDFTPAVESCSAHRVHPPGLLTSRGLTRVFVPAVPCFFNAEYRWHCSLVISLVHRSPVLDFGPGGLWHHRSCTLASTLSPVSARAFPLGLTWFRVLRFLPRQELFSASVSCFRRSGFRVPPSLFVLGLTVGVEPPRFSGSIVLQVVALGCKNFWQVEVWPCMSSFSVTRTRCLMKYV